MRAKKEELLELFLQTNDVDRLVELAARVLGNALVVCDTSYHFIARSDPEQVRDRTWLAGMKRDGWSSELVSRVSGLEPDYTGAEHRSWVLEGISENRRRLGALCMDGIHAGYYLVLEEQTPFEQVDEACWRTVAAVLTKAVLARRPGWERGGRDGESIMRDLLGRGFDSRSIFLERVGRGELARTGRWRVLCIPDPGRDEGARRQLRSEVGRCLPLSWQVWFEDSLVILADFGSGLYTTRTLEQMLEQNGLCAGVSDEFADTYLLRRHYEQARAAARLGGLFEDGRATVPYGDYRVYHLMDSLEGEDIFERFATPAVRCIRDYDESNGTDFLNTLRHYLGSGCSAQKAAARMYVHRNTVVYRVGRLRELFGLEFDDDWQNYLNYTSCLLARFCQRQERG